MTPRARKALLSLMIPLAFAPAVAGADDDVPALLQFAERYQRQDAPAAETVVTPSQESQKPASRPVQARETSSQRKQLAQLQKTLREKETRLEQQQAALQSLQQELTALRVASSLTAADKPTPAPDLSALSDFASGVRQALNLTPQERKAQAQIDLPALHAKGFRRQRHRGGILCQHRHRRFRGVLGQKSLNALYTHVLPPDVAKPLIMPQ